MRHDPTNVHDDNDGRADHYDDGAANYYINHYNYFTPADYDDYIARANTVVWPRERRVL
jgi:hypothetical protein